MTRTRNAIDELASRIERAYRRRHPRWTSLPLTAEVWEMAATRLLDAAIDGLQVPVDPELFVAVLGSGGNSPNPWAELTPRSAGIRYLKAVRLIIRRLRRELSTELRLAGRRIAEGDELDVILDLETTSISPLTRYILAFRAGRFDLLPQLKQAAWNQHGSCPLYQPASRPFLPDHVYPSANSEAQLPIGRASLQFSLN